VPLRLNASSTFPLTDEQDRGGPAAYLADSWAILADELELIA